jgi:hypothetical protein|tara:strand:- start:5481 stop:5870 length:390 start_codon:yes stop_codon:yes gene_type:complete
MNPFEYVKSITHSKVDIMIGEEEEKGYNSFLINRGLSYYQDTVLFANEMNKHAHLDNRLQFDFLRGCIRPRKRFSKWAKKVIPGDIEVVKEYYGYSNQKAESVIDLLTDDDIKNMKSYLSKGGSKKNAK